jgi:hypothetical protein
VTETTDRVGKRKDNDGQREFSELHLLRFFDGFQREHAQVADLRKLWLVGV